MVEFGKRLKQECAQHGPSWQNHCIDYSALKGILTQKDGSGSDQQHRPRAVDVAVIATTAAHHQESNGSEEEDDFIQSSPNLQFRYSLDREIEKAVLFVLQEQGSIAEELDRLARRRAKFVDGLYGLLRNDGGDNVEAVGGSSRAVAVGLNSGDVHAALNDLREIHEGYEDAARSILRFVAFVDLNVTAVRKILKKHDKITNRKLSHSYLSAYTNEYVDSHLDQLYNDGGLSSLVVTLRRAFAELHHLELELLSSTTQRKQNSNKKNKHRRINTMPASLGGEMNFGRSRSFADRVNNTENISANCLVTTHREPLLHMIQMSRDKLKQNTKYVDIIAAQALFFEDSDEISTGPATDMSRAQRLSSLLNLCSTFLYMTNYYIVAPTCGQYLAAIGSTESMAGIVIGMTPNAALIATVLYGWWSNHSYKSALIFAAGCSVAGNVAYGLALHYDSIELVMVGRFLNGFGSARSINRRFIADTFSKRDRTAASAAFVTAGALGMACGPALAAMLSQLSFSMDATIWTIETSPGWVMLCLWLIFLIAAILFFEEPDRSHLFGKKDAMVELTSKVENGENKPLLESMHSSQEVETSSDPPLYKNVPVMMTLWIYFILKLVLECLMSSCPTLTLYYFGWDSKSSGSFLAFLGLLMFPANMVVARLSHRYEDRELIYFSLMAILCSIAGFIAYTPRDYSVVQYMAFGICIFIATNALEGPNMGLLSKTIPKTWARGIFNTGFLATEAGTAARSVGDVWITLASNIAGVQGILNAIFAPMLVLVIASVALTRRHYDKMVEEDEDDVKSNSSN